MRLIPTEGLRARLGVAGVVAMVVLLAGCGGDGNGTNGPAPPGTATIVTRNDASAPTGFSFQSLVTVRSGAVVRWSNTSSASHDIVWDAWSPASSPAPGAGIAAFGAGAMSDTWTAPTVSAATAYNYHCGLHGPTMSGVVNVVP